MQQPRDITGEISTYYGSASAYLTAAVMSRHVFGLASNSPCDMCGNYRAHNLMNDIGICVTCLHGHHKMFSWKTITITITSAKPDYGRLCMLKTRATGALTLMFALSQYARDPISVPMTCEICINAADRVMQIGALSSMCARYVSGMPMFMGKK